MPECVSYSSSATRRSCVERWPRRWVSRKSRVRRKPSHPGATLRPMTKRCPTHGPRPDDETTCGVLLRRQIGGEMFDGECGFPLIGDEED